MHRQVVKHALWLVLLVAFVLVMSACEEGGDRSVEEVVNKTHTITRETTATGKPNILFVITDDMRASDLQYMPKTKNLLAGGGVNFTNAFVTRSLCCPSRATIFRGQYSHNHKIWGSRPPLGGFEKFRDLGHERSTIATWLNNAGYDTILIGKYLNGYDDTTYVPPGWDHWHGDLGEYRDSGAYQINENGRVATYDRSRIHDTDLFADKATHFIRDTASGAPFFMYLSTNAPHTPAYVADRHKGMFSNEPLPKPPSYNEADVSDKPAWVRNKPRLTSDSVGYLNLLYRQRLTSDYVGYLNSLYRQRLGALQSVDDMVGRLVSALRDTGELSNTYIVFTSDNGYYLGEHRLEAKAAAYEEAIRVPLLVRGPGVPQGVTRFQMALNNDLAPTFASWADVMPPAFVEGRSLSPLLSTSPPASWRTAFLVEHRSSANEGFYTVDTPDYDAVRTSRYLYVEYKTGERELYNLSTDPYELTSLHASAPPTLLSDLKARLDALKRCPGAECKTAEDGE
jgi:arylsulfatase A-like enzyme